MEEKILTRHPENKQGGNISKKKYDAIRQAILDVLDKQQEILFQKLPADVDQKLGRNFDGSVS